MQADTGADLDFLRGVERRRRSAVNRTSPGLLPEVPAELIAALEAACAHVETRATDRLAAAHDASHYLLTARRWSSPPST